MDGKQIQALDVDFSRSNADISEEIVERVAALSATPDDSLIVLADHAGARFHRLAAIVNPLRRRGYVVTRVFGRVIFGAGEVAPSRGVTFREAFSTVAQYVHYQASHQYAGREIGYFEFGMFEGKTFTLAYQEMAANLGVRFCGFDSFEGIIGSLEEEDFRDETFFCNKRTFLHNLALASVDLERVNLWQGNFVTDLPKSGPIEGVSQTCMVAHIDCDVMLPSKAALDFLTDKLVQGSVLMFDDYNAQCGSNKTGERAALHQWLAENPQFSVEPWFAYEGMAQVFFVHKDD
ncbi:hypothetical protein [Aliiroseovarius sp.]|uniref:hypothetical protein n=1 Tax=Aliiroseovarius sp. TaxID=1872442 RepID=UPI003BAD88CD